MFKNLKKADFCRTFSILIDIRISSAQNYKELNASYPYYDNALGKHQNSYYNLILVSTLQHLTYCYIAVIETAIRNQMFPMSHRDN